MTEIAAGSDSGPPEDWADYFEHAPVALLVLDADGLVLEANQAALALVGLERDTLRGTPLGDRVRRRDGSKVGQHVRQVIAGASPSSCDVTLRRPDGREVVVRLQSSVTRDRRRCRTAVIDVTHRLDAERRLAEREAQLTYALEAASAGVWDWNLAAGRVTWSEENYRVFDLDPDDAPDLTYEFWASRVLPEDLAVAEAAVRDALEGRSGEFRSEFRVFTREGGLRWVYGLGRVERDAAGTPVRMSGLNIDLSARKALEEAIRDSEARFRVMADHVPLLLWVHDTAGNQLFVNQTFRDYFGVAAEDVLGERWKALVHPEDAKVYAEAFAASVAERREFRTEVRVRRADGVWRWLESWGRPRLNEQGDYLGHVGASLDITDRKRAEDAVTELTATLEQRVAERTRELRESEARLRFLADSIPHLVWVAGPDGSVIFVNRRAVDYLGLPSQEILGWDWIAFLHPDEKISYVDAWKECVRQGAEFDGRCRFRRATDQTHRWHRVHGVPVRDASGLVSGWYGTATDIHESALAEAESRRLSKVFAEAADAILLLDLHGNILEMNPEAGRRYGWDPDSLRGRPALLLVPPEGQDAFQGALDHCRSGATVRDLEGIRITRVGERIPVLLTLSPFTDEEGAPVGIVNIAKDLRGQKLVETQLRESREVAELQRDIARFASRCRDLREMVDYCLDQTVARCGWRVGLACFPAATVSRTGALTVASVAHDGTGEAIRRFASAASRTTALRTGGWIDGILASGEAAWSGELEDIFGDRFAARARRIGIRSVAAFPVLVGSGLMGALVSFRADSPHQDPRLMERMASVGVQIGLVAERVGAERELRDSEARLRLLTDQLRDAVWLQEGKPTRRMRYHNPAFHAWFGAGEPQAEDDSWNLAAHVHPEERSFVAAAWERVWNGAEVDLECRMTLPDGALRWFRCRGYPVPDALGRVGLVVGIAEDVSERQEAAGVRRRLEEEVAAIAEGERLRISRELHDSLGSLLTGTRLRHQMIVDSIRAGEVPDVTEAETVALMIRNAIAEARLLTRGLFPVGEHPEDLMQALRGLAADTLAPGAARCSFRCPEPVPIQDVRLANELYRIAQEAFHNALKHSGATRIGISLARRRGEIVLTVQDNGCGLAVPDSCPGDPGSRRSAGGHGLQIMSYRASAMGGRLSLGKASSGGTRVICTVPAP